MKSVTRYLPLFFMLFIATAVAAQAQSKDAPTVEIDKNIFRLSVALPILSVEANRLLISYEHQVRKPFSFVIKAGPTLDVRGLDLADDPKRYFIQAYASAEFRYFFTLLHRIKKEKSVLNLSGPYLSVEQYIESNTLFSINNDQNESYEGSTGAFLQIGYQKQISQLFFNLFVGPRLYGNNFGPGLTSLDDYHIGLTLGYVF